MTTLSVELSEEELEDIVFLIKDEIAYVDDEEEALKLFNLMRKLVKQRKKILGDEERERMR